MIPELANLFRKRDGTMVPVENFGERIRERGLEAVMAFAPILEAAQVLAQLEARKESIKSDIFEITGIADIVRGASRASETLGAQQIKSQSFNLRTENRRDVVASFIREIYEIKAEYIADHFEPNVLTQVTGVPVPESVMEFLRNDDSRSFRVNVETDQTQDPKEEQKNRIELVDGAVTLMQQIIPLAQAGMLDQEVAKQLIMFPLRAFKGGRQLEDAINGSVFGGQQPQQPNPELQKMQADAARS